MNFRFTYRLRLLLTCAFFAALLTVASTSASAQVKITVSEEIISVKGVKMHVHNVKKGETIYSICKAYGVTAEELQRNNPVIEKGLKEGHILYIPVQTAGGKSANSDSLVYIVHKVRWFEDLDDIAEKYGVDKEDIKALNNMPSNKLKGFKKLKIPAKKKSSPYTIKPSDTDLQGDTATTDQGNTDWSITDIENSSEEDNYSMPEVDTEKTRTISVLLPLNSSGKPNANYMDFYSGALLALEQIKEDGGKIKLNVLDYSSSDLSQLASLQEIEESDLLIGPIRYAAIKEFLPVAQEKRIPIVSPLDAAADTLLEESPYIFQAALSKQRQNEAMAEMIAHRYRNCQNPNIILVYTQGSSNASEAEDLKRIMEDKGVYVDNAGGIGALSNMKKDKDNIIIAYTTAESTAAEILRNIDIKMIEANKVTVFGLPKWKGFETIDMNLYFKYNLQICMPYNVDLNRLDVKNFIRRYRSAYNREPSANAFSGFDIVYFFCRTSILGLREYAQNPNNSVAAEYLQKELLQLDLLQQKFRFVKTENGGWVNTAATQVSFNPDYTITSR